MAYRLAQSLVVFRAECNLKWPTRDKTSDGWIGDTAHASRKSDHNPWVKDSRGVGVVRAYDLDAGAGKSREIGQWIAEHVVQLARSGHPALTANAYVIAAGRIASPLNSWQWRAYSGSNGHYSHTHVSVTTRPSGYDSRASWGITGAPAPHAGGGSPDTYERGDSGPGVAKLQGVLNRWYPNLALLSTDGVFGEMTEERVKYFQARAGLVPDGIVGSKTKALLNL